MLDSIHHMALKFIKYTYFGRENVRILSYVTQSCDRCHYATL